MVHCCAGIACGHETTWIHDLLEMVDVAADETTTKSQDKDKKKDDCATQNTGFVGLETASPDEPQRSNQATHNQRAILHTHRNLPLQNSSTPEETTTAIASSRKRPPTAPTTVRMAAAVTWCASCQKPLHNSPLCGRLLLADTFVCRPCYYSHHHQKRQRQQRQKKREQPCPPGSTTTVAHLPTPKCKSSSSSSSSLPSSSSPCPSQGPVIFGTDATARRNNISTTSIANPMQTSSTPRHSTKGRKRSRPTSWSSLLWPFQEKNNPKHDTVLMNATLDARNVAASLGQETTSSSNMASPIPTTTTATTPRPRKRPRLNLRNSASPCPPPTTTPSTSTTRKLPLSFSGTKPEENEQTLLGSLWTSPRYISKQTKRTPTVSTKVTHTRNAKRARSNPTTRLSSSSLRHGRRHRQVSFRDPPTATAATTRRGVASSVSSSSWTRSNSTLPVSSMTQRVDHVTAKAQRLWNNWWNNNSNNNDNNNNNNDNNNDNNNAGP